MENSKSHTGFQLIPISTILNDRIRNIL